MTGSPRLTTMRVLAVAVFVLGLLVQPAAAEVLKVGDRMVELDVATTPAGKPFKLRALKGKWIFVTVGASWCVPCKKELPAWDKLAADANLKAKLHFVALNLDDDIADGKRFHKKLALKNMLVGFMPQEKSAVAARYGAATMPSTFVIDPAGVVRLVHAGFKERDASGEIKKMQAALAKLVK